MDRKPSIFGRLLYQIRCKRGATQRQNYVVGFNHEVQTRLLQSRTMEVIETDAEEFLARSRTKPRKGCAADVSASSLPAGVADAIVLAKTLRTDPAAEQ